MAALFTATFNVINPEYRETAKSNFLAIARGGLSEEYLFLTCFADYTVSSYLLGAGPTTVTVAYDSHDEAASYELYRREHEAGTYGSDPLQTRGDYEASLQDIVVAAEEALAAELGGQERIVFLAPMGAHHAIAFEAWLAVAHWDVVTADDDTINAVRVGAPEGDPEHTQTLANLTTRITTAAANDAHATTRIANVSGLQAHYRTMGAYGDITPGDGQTTTFTPAQPPAAPTCTNGTAVTTPNDNRGLVQDCETLLAAKDTLRGTATLDWATSTAVSSWEGITTGGTPSRVTELDLASESLTGSIPAGLGHLFELTTLDLSSNQLTGDIPAELGWLTNLTELRLSGNTLTGCIPLALRSVATNDLSSLNLLYCEPPAPTNLSAGTPGERSVALNWDAVTNASTYRVEVRTGDPAAWTTDDDTITGATHTVDELQCETSYELRVSAYGSGTTYAAAWGEPSAVFATETAACTPPTFGAGPHTFEISENAVVGAAVGTVTATDASSEPLAYAISGGNASGVFALDADSGALTVAGALNQATTPTYTLMVTASGRGGTATVTVTITVTEFAGDYDTDNDGLIEVGSLAQLHAMRWDLDGNGYGSHASYAAAFPHAATRMGCPATGCEGYELTTDLDFDTDGSGAVDAGDAYWNGGRGWEPIGNEDTQFNGTFHGNGYTIAHVFIDRGNTDYVGLFGRAGWQSVIHGVGLRAVDVTGADYAAGLAGYNNGKIRGSYVSGTVRGDWRSGGLVGLNSSGHGAISTSYSTVHVIGGEYTGGLVGYNVGSVTASYASGAVTGGDRIGGLVGRNDGTINASFATGRVTGGRYLNGLVGFGTSSRATSSYWDTEATGQSRSVGGTGQTTSALQTPTGYSGVYADWNVDLDDDSTGDDPWDFGTASQYPALKVDVDGNGTASWEEFGDQRPVTPPAPPMLPNHPPAFDVGAATRRAVAENTAAGQAIGTPVTATDPDESATLTYALSGTDAADFELDTASGQVRTLAALDYETQASYAVTVEVSDGRGGHATTAVTILVTDVADTSFPAPGAPTVRPAATDGHTAMAVSWTAPANPSPAITGYTVRSRAKGTATWTEVAITTAATTSTTLTNRTARTTYEVQVQAVNATDTSAWSASSEATTGVAGGDYDADGDGLIEVTQLAQLNAIRWDLDGDGTSTEAGYALAFPGAATGMGCPATGCAGYELTRNLDFDTDGDGAVDADDTYWNSGWGWAPLGDYTTRFAGTFDGNGHAMAHLFIDRNVHRIGLFGTANATSVIRNVRLHDVAVTVAASTVGGLVGENAGAISDSSVSGAVVGRSTVGGLVGENTGTISASSATGMASGTLARIGGLVGENTGTISASSATVTVMAPTAADVGGLAGENSGTISISAAAGGVSGNNLVGGLVGNNDDGTITTSYASGMVTGGSRTGGLVGENDEGTIRASYATGAVTGDFRTGGLVGSSSGTIRASYANGTVTTAFSSPSDERHIGGLVGENDEGTITASYATGVVQSAESNSSNDNARDMGGLVGRGYRGTITASFWDTATSGRRRSNGGVGQTTSALQTPTWYTGIYADWNVDVDGETGSDDPWDFGTAGEYPVLKVDFDDNGTATWEEFGDQRPTGTRSPANQPRSPRSLANRLPVFAEGTVTTRTVDENSAAGTAIGDPVTATDADKGDVVRYALGGTDAASFDLVTSTGQLQTKVALDYEAKPTYEVTIVVRDGRGGSASITVTIAVGDLVDTPPAPANLAAETTTATSIPLSWDAVPGVAKYRVEYRETDAETETDTATWITDDETLTTATHTVDELTCGTAYVFQVSTYGDGTTHTAEWGTPTAPVPAATSGCPPVFEPGPHAFGVAADAVVGTVVGTVTATVVGDEAIAHAITAGNDGDAFAIGETSGDLTVAAVLDAAATASYSLTVQASVGSGDDVRTATTTVTLTVQGAPPAPANLAADTPGETSVPLSWDAVPGAATYRVEYRATSTDTETVSWTTGDDTLMGTTHTVDALDCGTAYAFQVTAFGDQVAHTAVWGTPATAVPATTSGCSPVFSADSPDAYGVAEDAVVGTVIGTIAATVASDEAIAHAITDGNTGDAFAIDETSGELTVAAALDLATLAAYELTVQASVGSGDDVRTATTTGTLTVQGAPPAPQNLAAGTATATSVPLSWDAVAGAATYRVGYRETSTDTETEETAIWITHDDTLTSTTHTVDALECGTGYELRVTAYGDQIVHTAAWGTPATAVAATTAACLPEFGEDDYEFTVSESAAVNTEIDTVLATDPGGGAVSHAITAGNTGDAFAIDATTGAITVAAALDYLTTASYTLTVRATSAAGSTDATVTITVTGVDCANGTVIADPRDHAALVGDCRVLLAAQATLEGDAGALNWSEGLALAQWEGVSSSGTPSRVTGLDLSEKSLGGVIPTGLGGLTALTTLDLSDNALTGAVPTELSALTGLTTLALSGNALSGCVPTAIRTLAAAITAAGGTHDVAQLSLPYCDAHVPVPTGVSASVTSATSITVSWDGATDAGPLTYRVEYRQADADDDDAWTVDAEDVTATTHVVDDLTCGTEYEFQVSAKGDGIVSLSTWSSPSDSDTATTSACSDPCNPVTVLDATLAKVAGENRVTVTWAYGNGCTGVTAARYYFRFVQDYADGTKVADNTQSTAGSPQTYSPVLAHVTTQSPLVRVTWTQLQIQLEADDDVTERLTFDVDPAPTLVYNRPPAFPQDTYEFEIAEDAAVDAAVGSVSAPDPNVDDEVTYTITAGNTGDAFAIDPDSGAITVAAALDYEATTSYTLTVQAEDGAGEQDTATVTVTITNVVDTVPPALANLTATVNDDGEVVLSWDAPDDDSITGYQILRRRPTEGEDTLRVYVENTGTTDTTYTDTSVTAGVRHVYRVKAINAIGLSDQSNFARVDP